MKRKIAIIFTLIFGIAVTASAKQQEDINEVVDRIQKKYEKIDKFYADFDQEAEVRALDTVEKASGKVWFKKPGKMRWDYKRPTNDQIVSDGKTIWYYNEQEKQVMKSSLEKLNEESNSTTLISGLGKVKELFNASYASENSIQNSPESYLIELTPKESDSGNEEPYNRIIISVDKDDTLVREIYLFDPFGNKTKITLNNFRINKDISDSVFKFSPPNGAEVVDMSATGQVAPGR